MEFTEDGCAAGTQAPASPSAARSAPDSTVLGDSGVGLAVDGLTTDLNTLLKDGKLNEDIIKWINVSLIFASVV